MNGNSSAKKNISRILDIGIKNKKRFYTEVFFSLFSAVATLLIPLMIGNLLDVLMTDENNIKVETLFIGLSIFVVIYVTQGVSSYALSKTGIEAMENLQNFMCDHIVHLELKDSNSYAPGDMGSRTTNDINQVSGMVTVAIPALVKNVLIVICTTIILCVMNHKLTFLIIILLVLILTISHPVNNKLEKMYKIHQKVLGEISAEMARCISNMVIIKAFVGEQSEFSHLGLLFKRLKKNLIKIVKNETIWNVFLSCALMLDMVLVIIFANSGFENSVYGINALSTYILYMLQLLSPATELVNSITELVEANGAFQRIIDVLDMPRESNKDLKREKFTEGNISISDVSFCYDGFAGGLKNITIDITAKSMVAIVGPSGAGKTTIFSLILKLYKDYEGIIEIDKKNIRDVSTDSIREQVAYVPQSNYIVNGTVMDNLRYGKNNHLDSKEIIKILEDEHLMNLFDDFSERLYTEVGENGNKLSEGQKQRINIVRAIISNPIIMLLDEVTSSLDTKTEQEIMDIIEKQRKKSTVVVIAHRLNTVKNADKIYVLDVKGQIECWGSHEYLLQHSETYRKLNLYS